MQYGVADRQEVPAVSAHCVQFNICTVLCVLSGLSYL
jgi:hypothetical protein